jgi:hypothetical protein
MKTDDLIAMLSTNVEPVHHRPPWRTIGLALVFGAVAVLGSVLLALGLRPHLFDSASLGPVILKLSFAVVTLVPAAYFLVKLSRPGGERNAPLALLLLPFFVIALLAGASLISAPAAHWDGMIVGHDWLECLISIPIIAIVPFAIIVWAVRQMAPTDLSRAGALVGLVAGSLSAIGYSLHCIDDSVPFVAIWYGGTIALCTFAGWKLGPWLLRW